MFKATQSVQRWDWAGGPEPPSGLRTAGSHPVLLLLCSLHILNPFGEKNNLIYYYTICSNLIHLCVFLYYNHIPKLIYFHWSIYFHVDTNYAC